MTNTSYYNFLLNQMNVRETAVDCQRCEMQFKCCTYRPFIANFLVGGFASQDFFNNDLQKEWDFLIVGLSPHQDYRKYFQKKGKWGFGTDAKLLCSFYNKASGGCQIWSSRPAVCRTFFCKSSYGEAGAFYWNEAENMTWRLEWLLLEDFLHHKGWTLEEVAQVKAYLNEEHRIPRQALPQGAVFEEVSEARDFYLEAQDYVCRLSPEDVQQLLGERGRQSLDQLLAQKQNLR